MARPDKTLQQLFADLQPVLKNLETQKHTIQKRTVLLLALVIALAGVAYLGFHLTALWGRWGILPVMAGLILIFFLMWLGLDRTFDLAALNIFAQTDKYYSQFKSEVIGRLIYEYDPNLKYHPDSGISESAFVTSRLYRRQCDRYHSEDLIVGKIGATAFWFSEVHAEYKITHRTSKGSRTTWHTLFKGKFFIGDFNKHFNGVTVVLPDVLQRNWGGFGQMLQDWTAKLGEQPGDLVKLEDPEFEQRFAVYSTDQIEARYILSTSLMQRLVNLHQHFGQGVALSFINSCIYIALPHSYNSFEPPGIWSTEPPVSLNDIRIYLNDIRLAEVIIEDLKLNRRIWSK
jgi:hypothetical protein